MVSRCDGPESEVRAVHRGAKPLAGVLLRVGRRPVGGRGVVRAGAGDDCAATGRRPDRVCRVPGRHVQAYLCARKIETTAGKDGSTRQKVGQWCCWHC